MQIFVGFNYCKPLENYEDRKLQISKTYLVTLIFSGQKVENCCHQMLILPLFLCKRLEKISIQNLIQN